MHPARIGPIDSTLLYLYSYSSSLSSYHFKELHYVDWVQPSAHPDDNDMWSQYVPPRVRASGFLSSFKAIS